MRHLISSLQNHNLQLKGDLQRYKRKLRETQMEINKVDMVHVATSALFSVHISVKFLLNLILYSFFFSVSQFGNDLVFTQSTSFEPGMITEKMSLFLIVDINLQVTYPQTVSYIYIQYFRTGIN